MGEKCNIGIFFCHPENGHLITLDWFDIIERMNNISRVKIVWNSRQTLLIDIDEFAKIISENDIDRIIISGFDVGISKTFIASAMEKASKNPKEIILIDFMEYGISNESDKNKAFSFVECAVKGVIFDPSEFFTNNKVNQQTLIIGGGITGIQASLEIANAGKKVFLLEKTGTIGGHMAMFDKTFPTLDCAACILTPKMVEVGQHQNIEILTYSEVKEVNGNPGNYKVKIIKKARRVDITACIGCGICSEKCPSKVYSEFDSDTCLRKSIYIAFPQAVPNKYLIDESSCIYVESGKCGVCVKVCPADCIDLDEKDKEIEIDVGNIIVATGFKTFDAKKTEQYGYGKFPNVLTSLEFERLINASGPTGGEITFRSKDKKGNWVFAPNNGSPKSVAIIHCVGSRDVNHNKYCSRVCCMYSLKLAHLVKEKLPDTEVTEYFIDMRAFGKGYDEFYERIKSEDVKMIRGRASKIEQKNGQMYIRSEDIINDKLIEEKVDMVILAVGIEPRDDAGELEKILGITRSDDGWFMEANSQSNTNESFSGGITIAGVCQGPKDIPDSVVHGSAAASRVLRNIMKGKVKKGFNDFSSSEIISIVKEFSLKMEGKS